MARLNGEKCPTCGRFKKTKTGLREKLVILADGTRNIHELMELTGCRQGTIYVALTGMRKQGHPVKLKRVGPRVVLTREEFGYLVMLHLEEGLTWREIGELQQLTEQTIGHRYRQACKIYGKPTIKKSDGADGGDRSDLETQPGTTFACTI